MVEVRYRTDGKFILYVLYYKLEHERGRRFSTRLAPLARTDDNDDDENG
jgi:hypothetical protein